VERPTLGLRLRGVLPHVLLGAGVVVSLFPFYWMIVMATNTTEAIYRFPPKLTIGSQLPTNIRHVLDNIDFFGSMLNTLIVALLGDVPRAARRLAGGVHVREVPVPRPERSLHRAARDVPAADAARDPAAVRADVAHRLGRLAEGAAAAAAGQRLRHLLDAAVHHCEPCRTS
jgi:hypothetical protein